jgi:POT family proton-dependent oligopeptide transporter
MSATEILAIDPTDPAAMRGSAHRRKDDVFGHPRGLAYLVFAESWERFSFNGMQALLVLYMGHSLLLPGHVEHVAGFAAFRSALFAVTGPLSTPALASMVFGLYAGLVYASPLAGGYLADRWFGRTSLVTFGAVLMAAGHFLMAFEGSFLLALFCLIIGVGAFKGNISTQVGALYQTGDPRRAQAFQLFYLGINFALIFSPLICGTLGESFGWHWGFGAAGVGMIAGLVVYLSGRRWLPAEAPKGAPRKTVSAPKLTPAEWRRVGLSIALVPVLGVALLGNYQTFNAYIVWASSSLDLHMFGHAMPVTWLLAFGGVSSISMISVSVAFWSWWGRTHREPSEIGKCAIGAVIMSLAPLILAGVSLGVRPGHGASIGWGFVFQLVNDLGYANLVPVSYALFVRLAPPSIGGTMIAVCLLQFFLANFLAGVVGVFLIPLGAPVFWLLHTGLILAAGAVLAIVWARLGAELLAEHA